MIVVKNNADSHPGKTQLNSDEQKDINITLAQYFFLTKVMPKCRGSVGDKLSTPNN